MKRIAAFVFAFLAVWYLQATDADAQFRRECRYGFCGGGGGASGTPVSNACINSSGTTITFTAQGVGSASPNRISVVSINWSDSTAAGTAELTGVTLGGNTMVRGVRASGDNQNSNSEIWFVANPTGTTANIVATFSTAVDGITIEVYRLVGYNSFVPVNTTTGTTSVSQAYTNRQLAIAAGSRTTNVSTSLSNMTNDYSVACGANLWGVHASQKLSGSGTLSSSISPTGNNPKIALGVWAQDGVCVEASSFLARTSGLTSVYTAAYTNLICGLVTDSLYTKFDVLYVFATQNTTTANLNLVSTSFNATVNGSPTFVAGSGYTGTSGSSTIYINTGFNPTTAPSPKHTQNSAHLSLWNLLNAGTANPPIGSITPTINDYAMPWYNGNGTSYARITGLTAGGAAGAGHVGGPLGHFFGNRTGSLVTQGYTNGSNVSQNNADTSQVPPNLNLYVLGTNNNGTPLGNENQLSEASIGSGFNSTEVTNFYNRLRTYMTAVGVP